MNKLLLLLPSLASADLIQDLYKEQFYQLSKSNFEIITAFLLIFIIVALIYIFSLAKKSKHKTIVLAYPRPIDNVANAVAQANRVKKFTALGMAVDSGRDKPVFLRERNQRTRLQQFVVGFD